MKTLSLVDGDTGIERALESSLDAQISIEQQMSDGVQVAMAESELQPFGGRDRKNGRISVVIDTLLEKTRRNIKIEQYIGANTFLVLDLCFLPPKITDPQTLRPAYQDNYLFPKAITGELWTLAFGNPGMLILGQPEFEGKPCVESQFDKCGILVDTEYSDIAGLLVVVHPLGRPPQVYGLFRNTDYGRWEEDCPAGHDLLKILDGLVLGQWNDELDTNGWRLEAAAP